MARGEIKGDYALMTHPDHKTMIVYKGSILFKDLQILGYTIRYEGSKDECEYAKNNDF